MMKTTTMSFSVFIAAPVRTVFDFHTNFNNVQSVSPAWVKIRIQNAPRVLKEGDNVTVQWQVAGFWLSWDVRVLTVQQNSLIIDIQSGQGPFSFWKHEHHMTEQSGGTILTDTITYALPFGIIGRVLDILLLRSVQKSLFRYRHKRMQELFAQS